MYIEREPAYPFFISNGDHHVSTNPDSPFFNEEEILQRGVRAQEDQRRQERLDDEDNYDEED